MARDLAELLSPDRALMFRLTHVRNIRWILEHGLHARSSSTRDPAFIRIGLEQLIERRRTFPVPTDPGGTLADYVQIYFTPRSVMAYNIQTGYNDVEQHKPDDLVYIVASLPQLVEHGAAVVFTDRHAALRTANFYSDLSDLHQIDWRILQNSDFQRDADDPGKTERYQAEAFVYRHLPVELIAGIACYSSAVHDTLMREAEDAGCAVRVETRPRWYFR